MKYLPENKDDAEIVELLKAYSDEELEMLMHAITWLNAITTVCGIMAFTIVVASFFEPAISWFTVGIFAMLGLMGASFSGELEKVIQITTELIGKKMIPTVKLDMKISDMILAIRTGAIHNFGDFGDEYYYVFDVDTAQFGEIEVTRIHRCSLIGCNSSTVKFGAASTVRTVITAGAVQSVNPPRYTYLPRHLLCLVHKEDNS